MPVCSLYFVVVLIDGWVLQMPIKIIISFEKGMDFNGNNICNKA
jgi:hypothetical protein